MKMRKSLFILPLITLAAVSCNNTEDLLFDGSAAERLEQSKVDAKAKLTEDGGLWAMEYFANDTEQGYVMLFRFDKNGSVEVSANHKWIGSTFKQERSLWDIISDNGTVLTFNSYNNLFHVFSDPNDITGPDQPVNPDLTDDKGNPRPIDESGFGHEGDYEFQIMQTDDPSVIRLLGKKYGFNIYLHKLDSNTDEKEYLDATAAKMNVFNTPFKKFILTDRLGHEFVMTDFNTGKTSVYPRSYFNEVNGELIEVKGDSVTQTVSANGILTLEGFRYAKPFTIKNADESEWELEELFWAEDGTLVNTREGLKLSAPSPAENFAYEGFSWTLDTESLTGKFETAYRAAADAIVEKLGTKNKLGVVEFSWATNKNVLSHVIVTRLGQKRCQDFFDTVGKKGTEVSMEFTDANSTSAKYNEDIPEYGAFKALFYKKFKMENNDPMTPNVITFTLEDDPSSSFKIILS